MVQITARDNLPQAALPSWLLSLAFHLLVLIIFALLIRPPTSAGVAVEQDRSVGVALTRIDSDVVEYFDGAEHRDAQRLSPPSEAVSSESLLSELPDRSVLPKMNRPDLELPAPAVTVAADDSLIVEPELSSGRKVRLLPNQGVADILAADAAQRTKVKNRGPSAQVSLFGSAPAEGHSFMFVIDRSQSMGNQGLGVLSTAKKEFELALAPLEPTHSFQILAYNHDCVYFGKDKLVPATDANKRLVGRFLRGLAAFGATNHYRAVMFALHRSPDAIFLLTDGGDPALQGAQLATIRKKARSEGATIHCIQFGSRPWDGDENYMQLLARQNGGSFRYVDMSRRARRAVGFPSGDVE